MIKSEMVMPGTKMWKKFREIVGLWHPVLITATTMAGLVIVMRWGGFLQLGEWAAWDIFGRWRALEPIDGRIIIVTIDESDIQNLGHWPISDGRLAQLLEKLKQQQPIAIGMDLYRDLPVEPGHPQLRQVFESTPNLIGVRKVVGNNRGGAVNAPPLLEELNQIGAADLVLDKDGTIRRGLLSLKENGKTIYGLALRLALIYLQELEIETSVLDADRNQVKLGKAVFVPFKQNDGGYGGADAGGYQIVLNFRGPLENFHSVSLTDVLADRIPKDLMRDRIVLIGATAPSLNDLFYTLYSNKFLRTPGVVIHANIVSQILSSAIEGRPLIKVWSEKFEWLWILTWSSIGAILTWKWRSIARTALLCLLLELCLIWIAYLAFTAGWWIPVIPSLLALNFSAVVIIGYIAKSEYQERQILMNLFNRNVSPTIAAAIWRDRHFLLSEGRLVGQHLTATVLFTNIKGFSAIAEGREPIELMSWLNEYMNAMADIVFQYDGVVDKFIGDQIMAVFGVPIGSTTVEEVARDAIAAVSCAREMAAKLRQLNQQWRDQGHLTLAMGIGIATGTVVAGSLGSRQRLNYTTLGDTVNIASALKGCDQSQDGNLCPILISQETQGYIQHKFPTQDLGTIILKGRSQPVHVHQVLLD